jgi:hypothetical protein
MMSCTTSAAWSRAVLSLCCTEHDPSRGAVLSGRITTVAMSRSGQLGRRCTVGMHCSSLHVCKRLSNARSCLGNTARWGPWVAKPFFIPVAHSPLGPVGHVAAPELPSQQGRVSSRGTRGRTGAPLSAR